MLLVQFVRSAFDSREGADSAASGLNKDSRQLSLIYLKRSKDALGCHNITLINCCCTLLQHNPAAPEKNTHIQAYTPNPKP